MVSCALLSADIPNAIKGHRVYGRMWHVCMRFRKFPIPQMPSQVIGGMDYCIYQSNPRCSKCRDLNHGVPSQDHMVYQFLPFMR